MDPHLCSMDFTPPPPPPGGGGGTRTQQKKTRTKKQEKNKKKTSQGAPPRGLHSIAKGVGVVVEISNKNYPDLSGCS